MNREVVVNLFKKVARILEDDKQYEWLADEVKDYLNEIYVNEEQQPEAWIIVNKETGYRTQVSDLTPFLYHREIFEVIPLYTAPPVKSEHIEDNLAMFAPVGYLYKQMDCTGEWATIFKVEKPYITWHDIKDIVPVYTAPPKREPLDFEDLNTMWCGNPIDFARRIESIHGIGIDDE